MNCEACGSKNTKLYSFSEQGHEFWKCGDCRHQNPDIITDETVYRDFRTQWERHFDTVIRPWAEKMRENVFGGRR